MNQRLVGLVLHSDYESVKQQTDLLIERLAQDGVDSYIVESSVSADDFDVLRS